LLATLGAAGIGVLLLLVGAVTAVVVWSRGKFAVGPAAAVALAIVALQTIGAANGYPGVMATLSTAEPVRAQLFELAVGLVLAGFVVGGGLGLLAGLAHTWLGRRPPAGVAALAVGVSAGAVLAGTMAVVTRLGSDAGGPEWPNYAPANVLVPVLQPLVSAGTQLVAGATILLLLCVVLDRVTAGWTRRRTDAVITLLWLGMLIYGMRFEMRGSLAADLARWAPGGLAVGVGLMLAYQLFRRFGPGVVPVLMAVLIAMSEWGEALARPVPSSVVGALLVALGGLAGALLWSRVLARGSSGSTSTAPPDPVADPPAP
jgi:hypothetical protein